MDELRIENLEVFAHHGVYERETKNGQNFLISIKMMADMEMAAKTDDLNYAIDYGKVCHFMHAYFSTRTYKLIETAAYSLAEETILNFPAIQEIEVEIKKPEAPIGLPFGNVSIKAKRKWHDVFIAIGSNIGDKNKNIEEGIKKINELKGCEVLEVSSVFKSKPYGMVEQDDFLNGAFTMRTILSPTELLKELKKIEEKAGKGHTVRWGPRTLDLDIIFYDDLVLDSKELQIPHPDLQNRDFVLVPLSELADYHRHPVTKLTVRQMIERLKENTTGYILD
ncbi:dihydroneopterin aldolase/2-amino-4-hydroxy-6-hydroxymethyldihydropteridine diphosphokinase [Aequitasia blattaphilus]|uniref:Bifunctional folate synthesis protein n=1 Tax=Aequitasia blattaphilus TaxID=2949332 RepID=A0ABT1EB19_9FIRM|nr:2-amino-4-hydroxy-6-hydroxymethyldihydropteridine diphosphokinase [Aequitasia blattaphilus]MCP1102819.1 2-amino-4-hydroxy-6-hydroxymethyldihydropteridine diphosphokinase [Aequitasia blattaphilus]MCR8615459.1 2-amino-4-hydroxy-6-hydroxymethyldihydropteridine diphosphokinase [Aequitasia blattaphilus]